MGRSVRAHGVGGPHPPPGGQHFSDDFHVFSVILQPQSIGFLVDDASYEKATSPPRSRAAA
jgi:hypothetical protein